MKKSYRDIVLTYYVFVSQKFLSYQIGKSTALCNEIGNFVHLDKPFEAIFYEWFGLKSWSSDLKKKLTG